MSNETNSFVKAMKAL